MPYLARLGISHVYCSPILAAREGSTHGYDVADPTHISDAIGGEAAFIAFANEAHERGMGILLDIVPNHMGIGADNPYWDDVLRQGRASPYADWFDVSWRTSIKSPERILVPVLGDALENVLARGEITIGERGGSPRLSYYSHDFPIDPATLTESIDQYSTPAALGALLGKQHYRLAYWRVGQRDLNYRRFFDVNELISLRVELEEVFNATHAAVLDLVRRGLVDALRVDHVDGLLEPRRYLERLRSAVDAARAAKDDTRVPIYVEKILGPGESLPMDWPCQGTTGYEFLTAVDDMLIDAEGLERIESRYSASRAGVAFDDVAASAKRRVLRSTLNADVRRVAPMLATLATMAGWGHLAIASCAGAIIEFIAHLTVYRTYVDAEHPLPNDYERPIIEGALQKCRTTAAVDAEALKALEMALFGSVPEAQQRSRLDFVLRLQQLSGPAAAKGVEDTALYTFAPLTARSEVGGAPGIPVSGAEKRLHALLARNAERLPLNLNATNTHDTKRSADSRAAIIALSQHATEWERALRRWMQRHKERQRLVLGRLTPTRRAQDFIYQSLLAVWPIDGARDLSSERIAELRRRVVEYMIKASREAKVGTSWLDPEPAYEQAITDFVSALLGSSTPFVREMDQLVEVLAADTRWNALSRQVLHYMSPGVPDTYQGDELWFQALVDPDNRRPVQYTARAELLAAMSERADVAQLRDASDLSPLKMFVMRTLLALRKAMPELVTRGSYAPVEVAGDLAKHVFGFRREAGGEELVVLVARNTCSLGRLPVREVWADTAIASRSTEWQCALQGTRIQPSGSSLFLRDIFTHLPAAVLVTRS